MAYNTLDTSPGQKTVSIGKQDPNDSWANPTASYPYRRTADRHADLMPVTLHPRPSNVQPGLLDIESILEDQRHALRQIARGIRLISAPWLVEPPDSESFHKGSGIVMPAISATVFSVIASVTCPPGRNGVLNRIANVIVGGAFSDFSGDFVWQIRRNQSGNATDTMAERNYENITASYGLIIAPAQISGIRIFENDVIQLVGRNNALPLGTSLGGLLGGYFYPRTWDDQFDRQDSSNSW
jgi:hypothetical protein